ncbi:MAG: putative membrane protein [Myxococcota bacterium]|jgi:putative membrane protein
MASDPRDPSEDWPDDDDTEVFDDQPPTDGTTHDQTIDEEGLARPAALRSPDLEPPQAAIPWRRLHPLSVLVNLLPTTWRFLRNSWILIAAVLYGRGGSAEGTADLLLLSLFLMMTIGRTVVHFLTLRYRVAEGRLEIRSGLLNRQTRVIAPDRIQNTELVRNVFHRMSGLVEVRIETASGTEVEGMLSALSTQEAERLIAAVESARRRTSPRAEHTDEDAPVIAQNSVSDLVQYGLTASRLGATAVLIGLGLEFLQVTDPQQVEQVGGGLGWIGTLALLLALVTGTWLAGTVTAVVRHYGFTLRSRNQSVLVASEGLLTRRRVELPLRKLQVVTVTEPWLRRLVGMGTVHLETAAAREGGDGTANAEAMVPMVPRAAIQGVVRVALPALDVDLDTVTLHPPHAKALRRALIGASWRGLLFGGVLTWWFWPWGALGLLLLPLNWAFAVLDFRHQGWLVTPSVVISRTGYLNRRTRILPRSKLQSSEVQAGPILMRWGLGSLVLRVAGDAVTLPLLAWDQATALQQELLLRPLTAPEEPCPRGPA